MKNKLYFILAAVFMLPFKINSQNVGELKGTITDASSGTTIPGASVSYSRNGMLFGAVTDSSGVYALKPLEPGNYDFVFSFLGYNRIELKEVYVSAGTITWRDVKLSSDNSLPPVIIIVDREPLIRRDETLTGFKLLPADIKYSAERDIKELAMRSSAVYQKREGGALNIRGGRDNATQFIVDGMKMIGDFSLPKAAIKEMFVITGGIPAMYGDVTGGIVVIVTKSYADYVKRYR